MNTIDIVIADDHPFICSSMREILTSETRIRCVGEAHDGEEMLRLCRERHPRLLLMDLHLPHLAPVEPIQEVRHQAPDTKIIVLSTSCPDSCLGELIAQGISGFLLEDEISGSLVPAIRTVVDGLTWFCPAVIQQLIHPPIKAEDTELRMTERELSVITLVAQGHTNAQIAKQLSVSRRTVDHDIETLLDKFNAQNRTHLVSLALAKGVLPVKRVS